MPSEDETGDDLPQRLMDFAQDFAPPDDDTGRGIPPIAAALYEAAGQLMTLRSRIAKLKEERKYLFSPDEL